MEKIINPDDPSKSSITRMVYDNAGRLVQIIPPNLYNPELDNLYTRRYADNSVGTRYRYNSKGQVESVTDPENNVTKYTYDIYGNVETEEKPNGAVYKYDYDAINRMVKLSFKDRASLSSYTVLEEYKYTSDNNPVKETIRHLSSNETAKILDTFDYAQRHIRRDNPSDIYNAASFTSTQYYGNGQIKEHTNENGYTTYFNYDKYDAALKMKYDEKWTPVELVGSTVQYNYTRVYYDYAGRIVSEWTSDELVEKDGVPQNYIKKTIGYYSDGKIKHVEHGDGRRIDYLYDYDRNLTSERIRKDSNEEIRAEYENNHLGKPYEKREYIRRGDITGNLFTDNGNQVIKTIYKYDLNGNIENVIREGVYPNLGSTHTITYTYDKAGRSTGSIELVLDYDGTLKEVQTHSVLNWEGNPTKTEVKVNDITTRTTSYNYNPRGFLTSVTSPVGTTLYDYDRGGRLIAEVSPENYRANSTISNMDRNIYTYDKLDRLITKAFRGRQGSFNQNGIWTQSSSQTTVVQKAYRYDKAGNVIKELDALGFSTASGSSDAQKINNGYGIEYAYNPINKVTAILDAQSKEQYRLTLSNAPKRFKYDALGRKVEEIVMIEEANGIEYSLHSSSKKFEYDSAGNIKEVQVKRNNGAYTTIASATYDYLGNALTKTDGNNNTTTYTYNAFGKLRSVTTPSDGTINSNTINYQYDVMGNLSYKQDKKGSPIVINDANTYFTYDNHGRLLTSKEESTTGSDSIGVSFKYDVYGNLRFETDANGYVTEYRYDDVDRLIYKGIEVTNINNENTIHSVSFDYDKNGNKLYEMDHLGNKWEFVYDSLNRLREKKDPYNQSIQKLNYNINNAQTESFDGLNNMTIYNYDKNNRLISTIDPEKKEKSTTYDIAGNVKTVFDGKNTTYYGYDYRGRLKSVSAIVEGQLLTTSYEYDNNDNLIEQTNAKNHTTTYEYNCANKLIRIIDNGGRTGTHGNYTYDNTKVEYYRYNADGTLNDKVDRNGERTRYRYDVHGRLEEESVGKITISYTYDDNGNMLTVTDSTGTTVRTYDELSRVTSKTVPYIGKITYLYDIIVEDGLLAETLTDPKGNITTKVFDKAGRLKTVKDGYINSTVSTEYTYYTNGRRKSVVYPGGLSAEYTYYDNGMLKTLTNKRANGVIMDEYSYTYDAAGNQDSKTELINGVEKGTTSYTYDELNRLKTVTEPNLRKTTYTYDRAGNRETETIESGSDTTVNTYAYNDQDRLNSVTTRLNGSVTETTGFSYDDNGNQLTIRRNNELITTNEYNEKNQLVRTTTNGTTVVNTYNGEGLRVAKEVNGSLTRYMYEYLKVILEVDGSGKQVGRNLYGINLLMRDVDGESYYYMYNGNADVTALINSVTSQIDATYYYDAFGNILESTGNVNNSITYKGYQWDEETGLYYLNARMYDPKIARFLQEDTYRGNVRDPLSLNLYAYCANNPIIYYDPTGHSYEYYLRNKEIYLRDEVEDRDGGKVIWNNIHKVATFSLNDITMHYKVENGKAYEYDLQSGEKGSKIGYINNGRITVTMGYFENTFIKRSDSMSIQGTVNDNKNVLYTTREEAAKYILAHPERLFSSFKVYIDNVIESLPQEIVYVHHNYTYVYILDEHRQPALFGVRLPLPSIHGESYYSYQLAYTNEPQINEGIFLGAGLFKGVANSNQGTPKTGKLVGSTSGLKSHEVKMVNDLVKKGNTVEVVPRSNIQGVKTYDLKVNGVATELKTLTNPNTGTGAKRIYEGFQQGADTVMIDGRQAGLTSQQAKEMLSRAAGKYTNKQIPGNVQIWTNDGIITYP
ncbi:UNVERIFIED_CONTAM: RHS repeat-associated protein [Acetivibrio alkalicellulosi]